MTLFHFANCLALACGPYFMLYKVSGLSEYGVFWKCVQAGGIYILTQLFKVFLIVGNFYPHPSSSSSSLVGIITNLLRHLVNVVDLVGLGIVMTKFAGKGEAKFFVGGLGWASAELLIFNFIPLWIGARGIEFDWKYLQMSFDCNINLVHHITTGTFVWLWTRQYFKKEHYCVIFGFLLVCCFRQVFLDILLLVFGLGPWALLGIKAAATAYIALASYFVYTHLKQYFVYY